MDEMTANTWLGGLRALLIDLDGVMYRGEVPLPGAVDLIPALKRLGIKFAFVTNNATLTPEQYEAKLGRMGIEATRDQVVTSPIALVAHLQAVAARGARVCVVGEGGLVQALTDAGFEITDSNPAFVVAGLDRQLTFQRLVAATRGILGGAAFIATNTDPLLPVEDGLWPGAGSIVGAIATATGVQPTVIGKPEPAILQVALERLSVKPREAAIVGDQVQTDIRAGRAAGVFTILMASDLATDASDVAPDLVVHDLYGLIDHLQNRP